MTELQVVSIADVLTLLGFMVALAAQIWGAHRWLSRQLERRDDALRAAIYDFQKESRRLSDDVTIMRSQVFEQTARQDKEIAMLDERVQNLPTRKDMSEIVRAGVAPLESHIGTLLELIKANGAASRHER